MRDDHSVSRICIYLTVCPQNQYLESGISWLLCRRTYGILDHLCGRQSMSRGWDYRVVRIVWRIQICFLDVRLFVCRCFLRFDVLWVGHCVVVIAFICITASPHKCFFCLTTQRCIVVSDQLMNLCRLCIVARTQGSGTAEIQEYPWMCWNSMLCLSAKYLSHDFSWFIAGQIQLDTYWCTTPERRASNTLLLCTDWV